MDSMANPDGEDGGGFMPLSSAGVDFSNETQAFDFLQDILDDSYFQIEGNAYARAFWYGVVIIIALAAIVGLVQRTLLRSRKTSPVLAAPANALIAVGRECSTVHFTPRFTAVWLQVPPMGSLVLVVMYFSFIMVLEFVHSDYPGAQHYQAYGIRAAWLAVAQVPLIILLAGKNNLVGLLTGVNYQRLNILHRWVARGLLMLASMHFGFQSTGWNKYGLMQMEWNTDACPPTGMAAYAILLWINIANLRPFRHLSYSLFVIQHILMFFGFIIALMIHLPSTALYSRIYIWIGLGLYLLDRTVRTVRCVWNNKSICDAHLECLDEVATKISIKNSKIKHWAPGAHILLAIPRFGFLQTHPATVVSTPTSHDGDLVFILKAHKSFTRRLLRSAAGISKTISRPDPVIESGPKPCSMHKCIIDGPYSSSHLDFGAFEVASFIAGGTGITFTIANFLDLADRAEAGKPVPKAIDFVWIVKRRSHLDWVRNELDRALHTLNAYGCMASCTIYITQDLNPCITEVHSGGQKLCRDNHGVRERNPHASSLDLQQPSFPLRSRDGIKPWDDAEEKQEPIKIQVRYGRPDIHATLLKSITKSTTGETTIATCGPLGLTVAIRNRYVRICDDRAVCKGSGLSGIYLHVENQYN